MIRKVLVREGKKVYWRDGDLHTQDGVVKASDLEVAEGKVVSHSGKAFKVYEANFLDQLKKCKRGPQTLLPKDLAYILHYSAVDKDSLVVDAGAGCGFIAATLARHAKKVVSYDVRKDHLALVKKNMDLLGINNVELKEGDVYEKIDEKNVDVLTLDLPEPWQVDTSCVKNGGTIIVYLPTIHQVMEFCDRSQDYVEKVVELLEREWHVLGRKVRPKSQMQGHTGFLIIVRKI